MGSMKNDYCGLSEHLFNPHGSYMEQIVSYTGCRLTGIMNSSLNQYFCELNSTCDVYGRTNSMYTLQVISQLRCRLYTFPSM
uniref:Uncharacterized protein n=1 Tax=Arundo donax TaxID=35708 RepID=A0A0A9DVE5_ARUDO